jgi:hypothetical protein
VGDGGGGGFDAGPEPAPAQGGLAEQQQGGEVLKVGAQDALREDLLLGVPAGGAGILGVGGQLPQRPRGLLQDQIRRGGSTPRWRVETVGEKGEGRGGGMGRGMGMGMGT